jgi:endonuclease/exonuclease/phosphatase family metal-dependent hydrolase
MRLRRLLALAVGVGLALLVPVPPAGSVAAPAATGPTAFRVATFNALGHSHTEPGGDRTGYEDGRRRMLWATQVIHSDRADIVGFQELETPQYRKFAQLMPSWSMWPTAALGTQATANTIVWSSSVWTAVVRTTFRAPYFHGTLQPRPLVQLRNNATGQLVWVLNTHNPANTFGDAQRWRDDSERIEAALVNRLRAEHPGVPVLLLGDMNDRERFYCPVTYLTELESASGGTHGNPPDGTCVPAGPVQIDWVMGTHDITFSGYTSRRDALVRKASDHPYIAATASVPSQPARAANIKRVVVIDVEGLPSAAVNARRTPTLARMRNAGASTLHARSAVESGAALPNTVSILTGRPVASHRVRSARDTGRTIQSGARQYVSGVFDLAHDLGLTTSLYSGDPRAAMLTRSWGARHGGPDSYGADNGRRKISTGRVSRADSTAVAAARRQLATRPTQLSVVQLGGPAATARTARFGSRKYYAALKRADARVAGILRTVNAHAATRGTTLVIVTSSTSALPSRSRHHGLPLIVRGPGVPHADLYALNPGYTDPGTRRTTYSGAQPIRTGVVANLVTTALRLPAIPRSTFNVRQAFTVFPAKVRAG